MPDAMELIELWTVTTSLALLCYNLCSCLTFVFVPLLLSVLVQDPRFCCQLTLLSRFLNDTTAIVCARLAVSTLPAR